MAGVIVIATNVAGVTVRLVEPPMPATVALTVTWPGDALVVSPLALAVAIVADAEFQAAERVRFSVLPSE